MRRQLLLLSIVPLWLFSGACGQQPAAPVAFQDLQAVADWGRLPEGWNWGKVSDVVSDSEGRIYVGHRGEHPIVVMDAEGRFLGSFGEEDIPSRTGRIYAPRAGEEAVLDFSPDPQFDTGEDGSAQPREVLAEETFPYVHGLAVDSSDNLWVTDIGRSLVLKFSPEGTLLLTLGTADAPGEDAARFNQPTDVAVSPGGEIFVTDGYINARVVKFAPDGRFLKAWGKHGTGPGEFRTPHAVTLDGSGRVYVSDRANERIQIFDGEGNYLREWNDLGLTGGGELNALVFAPDGFFYGGTGRGNKLIRIDSDGRLVDLRGSPPSTAQEISGHLQKGPWEFNVIHGVCLDRQGNLYAAEVRGKRVQKFLRP